MTTIITGEVSDREKRYIRDRIRQSFDPGFWEVSPPGGFPEQIAAPATGNAFKDFQRRVGRATCDRWARGDRPGIVPFRDNYYREMCEPYLGGGLPGVPTTAPPYTGGQCPGVAYGARYTWTNAPGGTVINYSPGTLQFGAPATTMYGPLTYSGRVPGLPRCSTGSDSFQVSGFTVTGEPITRSLNRGGVFCRFASTPDTITNLSFERLSPGSECGDVPDEFNPGTPNPTPDPNPGPVGGPSGYPFPDFNIDINPDGTINIDFGDGSPPEVFDPVPDTDGGGGAPVGPGSPGAGGATGSGGEEDGEAPDGSELTGLLVTVLSAPPNANKMDNVAAVIYRGIGYVSMGFPGLLGLDTSAAIVQSPQFFHAQQRGLTAWRVRANIGYNLETTPYYRETD